MRIAAIALLLFAQADDKRLRDKLDSISEFLKTAKTPIAFRAAVDDLLALGEDAVASDAYDIAVKAMDQADKVAKSLKDPALSNAVQSKGARVKLLQQEWSRVRGFMKTLEEKPEDGEANSAVGKFLCLIKADWEKGLPLLRKGSDVTLRTLAEADFLAGSTVEEKVQVAERWASYSEKNPKAKERALHWFKQAWPDLRGVAKEKARMRVSDLQALPGVKDKEWVPTRKVSGWTFSGESGLGLKYAVNGKYSARISNPNNQPSYVMMDRQPARAGKDFVVSVWVLSDQTEAPGGHVAIYFYDKDNKSLPGKSEPIGPDFPFWQKLEFKGTVPPEATVTAFDVVISTTKGSIWIDDISVKVEGGEIMKNASFEDK